MATKSAWVTTSTSVIATACARLCNGARTATPGFSQANPQRLYLPIIFDPENHYEAVNVEAQQQNLSSILWWTKRLITLRRRFRAFGHGSTEFLYPNNRRVLVFIRRLEAEVILTVANLSRFVQCVEIDLSAFKGKVPVELFGQTEFPPIGDLPYFVTLGPHGFYWFKLETAQAELRAAEDVQAPVIEIAGAWDQVIIGSAKAALEKILPRYLQNRRWFGGKARKIRSVKIIDAIAMPVDSTGITLLPWSLPTAKAILKPIFYPWHSLPVIAPPSSASFIPRRSSRSSKRSRQGRVGALMEYFTMPCLIACFSMPCSTR